MWYRRVGHPKFLCKANGGAIFWSWHFHLFDALPQSFSFFAQLMRNAVPFGFFLMWKLASVSGYGVRIGAPPLLGYLPLEALDCPQLPYIKIVVERNILLLITLRNYRRDLTEERLYYGQDAEEVTAVFA
jgi:hypothetical protein